MAISREEADARDAPWVCGPRLMAMLDGWRDHAVEILQRPEITTNDRSAQKQVEMDVAAREAAQRVLGAIAALRDAIFQQQDKCVAAERGLQLGIELARAHTLGFVLEYQTGAMQRAGARKGGGHNRTNDSELEYLQRLAEEIWVRHPAWNNSDVARQIIRDTGGHLEDKLRSFDSIRTRIKKPA